LPPSESLSTRVSAHSRYGTCEAFSTSAPITYDSVAIIRIRGS
jgi:hypothetical protein